MSDTYDDVSRLDHVLARASAMLGLAGALFIIITFLLYSRLRRPMNRLLFFSSLGNLFLDTFYFISNWGIPESGGSLALCRTQGFMIQVFAIAPSMWTTSMAINVYLIVYKKFTTLELRKLEPWYIGINFGIPFLVAFVLLVLDVAPGQRHIYGPATLWCWVDTRWQWLRLGLVIIPIWVMIVICFFLFMVTGWKIIFQTLELKRGGYGIDEPITVLQVGTPFGPPNHVVRFTEVKVTEAYNIAKEKVDTGTSSAPAGSPGDNSDQVQPETPNSARNHPTLQDLEKFPSMQENEKQGGAYGTSCSTTSTTKPLKPANWFPRLSIFDRLRPGSLSWGDPRAVHALRAAEAYAKISILVFLSLVAIQTPSGVNRIYMVLHNGRNQPIVTHFQAALNPSQGILDAIIYIAMSWHQIKAIVRDTLESIHKKREKRRRRRQTAREFVQ